MFALRVGLEVAEGGLFGCDGGEHGLHCIILGCATASGCVARGSLSSSCPGVVIAA